MSRLDFVMMQASSIASSGSGAVTMVAVTGMPTVTQAFGSSTRYVDYTISDMTNNFYEKGYGSIAANVLTRLKVHETWSGTVYSTANTPFAFNASPAANQIIVDLGPTADAFMAAPPAIQTALGGSALAGWEISSQNVNTSNFGSGASSLGTTLEYYVPYLNIIRGAVSGFGLSVNTAGGAGAGIKAGIYEVGSDGLPGNCIALFNAISVASLTGFLTDTTPGTWSVNTGPLRLCPGWFFIGLMSNDTSVILNAYRYNNSLAARGPLGHGSYGQNLYAMKTQQNSYATGLPSGLPTGTFSVQSGNAGILSPTVALKIGN